MEKEFENLIARSLPKLTGDNEVLKNTPSRAVKGWADLLAGYTFDISKLNVSFWSAPNVEVSVEAIPFVSVCEHHLLPFFGELTVTYTTNSKTLGLSKVPRLVKILSAKLQLQEKLVQEIAETIFSFIQPKNVKVEVIKSKHICMCGRGANSNANVRTTYTKVSS